MGIDFDPTIDEITKETENFVKRVTKNMHEATRKASDYMRQRIRLSYDNRGYAEPKSRREGAIEWKPTTFIARKARKNYPKSTAGQKKGKKGLTKRQSAYLWTSPTLEDTGELKGSITEEEELFNPMELSVHTGASKDYIAIHEEGGTYKGLPVPERPSQYINDSELKTIEKVFLKAFHDA